MSVLPYDEGSSDATLLVAYDHSWLGNPWSVPPAGHYDKVFAMRVTVSTTAAPPPLPPPPASPPFYVDPMTVKIAQTRRAPFSSSKQEVDVAAQRGECERVQLWFWDDTADLYAPLHPPTHAQGEQTTPRI